MVFSLSVQFGLRSHPVGCSPRARESKVSRTCFGSETFPPRTSTSSRNSHSSRLLLRSRSPPSVLDSSTPSRLFSEAAVSSGACSSVPPFSSSRMAPVLTLSTTTRPPYSSLSVSLVPTPRSSPLACSVSSRLSLPLSGCSSSSTNSVVATCCWSELLAVPSVCLSSAATSPVLLSTPQQQQQLLLSHSHREAMPPSSSSTSGPPSILLRGTVPPGLSTPRCTSKTFVLLVRPWLPQVTGSGYVHQNLVRNRNIC